MKKVVQQLRLEAGLNRVKVSGRGRAVGPGVGGKREATRGSRGRAVGEEGARPSAARRLLAAPASRWRLPSRTSHPRLTPSLRPLNTLESAWAAPDGGLMSNFADRPGSLWTPPLLGPASNKEVFGADAVACSWLTLLSVCLLVQVSEKPIGAGLGACGLVGGSGLGLLTFGERPSVRVGSRLGIQLLWL